MQLASPKPAQNQPKTSPKPAQNQPKIQPKTSPKLAQNLHKSQIMLNNNYKKAHHVTYMK
jgi:hypothetical protein